MDDEQLTAGLSLLAEELTDPDVDIDAAIDTARLRTHYRQSVAATAAGTVLVIAAIATVVATTDRGADDAVGTPPSCAPTSHRPSGTKPGATISGQPRATTSCGPTPADWTVDQRARELTDQLAAARANLIPSSLRVDRDDSINTRPINGGPPPALEFGTLDFPGGGDQPPAYTAFAKLTDQQGAGFLRIDVGKGEHSSASIPFQPCVTGSPNCTSKEFSDGTEATWHTHIGDAMGWTQIMGAVRPDGTTITVSISVWPDTRQPTPTRPEVPLTPAQLYEFATVFDY